MEAEKQIIRKQKKLELLGICGEFHKLYSEKIQQRALELDILSEARVISCYISMKEEVQTDTLINGCLAKGKVVCVPLATQIALSKIYPSYELHLEYIGQIPQPKHKELIDSTEVDIFFIPGIAYDYSGVRLGRGWGYYDKLLKLAKKDAIFVGLCYQIQLIPQLPNSEHDIRVHMLITEKNIYQFTQEKFLH